MSLTHWRNILSTDLDNADISAARVFELNPTSLRIGLTAGRNDVHS